MNQEIRKQQVEGSNPPAVSFINLGFKGSEASTPTAFVCVYGATTPTSTPTHTSTPTYKVKRTFGDVARLARRGIPGLARGGGPIIAAAACTRLS